MKKSKLFLAILFWLGLPPVLSGLSLRFKLPASNDEAVLLFLLYAGFSWSIAVLVFVVESARQQLLYPAKPGRSALHMGIYGTVAVVLALFSHPEPGIFLMPEKLLIIGSVFLYGGMMGYIYQLDSNSGSG